MLRGGFGIFYDRPFDLITETASFNNLEAALLLPPLGSSSVSSSSLQRVLQGTGTFPCTPALRSQLTCSDLPGLMVSPQGLPSLLWIDQGLRTPYAQNWFAGVQQQVSGNLYIEISQMGALGRKLIATDQVNRCAPDCTGGRAPEPHHQSGHPVPLEFRLLHVHGDGGDGALSFAPCPISSFLHVFPFDR